jgi:hypothetical protein
MTEDDAVPTLHDLPAQAQQIVLAYYEAGLTHGYDLGYRAAEARHEAGWAAFAALARAARSGEPYDQVCERLGEHERAEQHRRLMRERGITP